MTIELMHPVSFARRPSASTTRVGRVAQRVALGLALVVVPACDACGERAQQETEASPLDGVLKDAKAARGEAPVDVLPGDVTWAFASPDPAEWKRFADERALFKALSKSPLVEDARLSGPLLTLEGIRHQLAGLTSFVGAPEDGDALFMGPIAIGVVNVDSETPGFVVAKRLDPTVGRVASFAAAFAGLASGAVDSVTGTDAPTVTTREVAGVNMRTVTRGGAVVAFAFFKDLLIFGTEDALVERAVSIAAGQPGELVPFVKTDGGRVLAKKGEPGIHFAHLVDDGSARSLTGARALGISLVLDPVAPIVLRWCGASASLDESAALLRYVPASAFAAVVDGRKVHDVITPLLDDRLEGLDVTGPLLSLAEKLDAGVLFAAGVLSPDESGADPAVAVVVRHRARADVEVRAKALLERMTGTKVSRTVLEHAGGAVVFEAASGPAFGITDDALVAALDVARVRAVLSAGAAQAPRLVDRAALAADGPAALGLYVDVARAGGFLERFYAGWAKDDPGAPKDALATLTPTFQALGAGGHGFARLVPVGDDVVEGAFRVLP
jgi:hypothetical protein